MGLQLWHGADGGDRAERLQSWWNGADVQDRVVIVGQVQTLERKLGTDGAGVYRGLASSRRGTSLSKRIGTPFGPDLAIA